MLKWAYNPQLRANSAPVTVKITEDSGIELNDILDIKDEPDARCLTERIKSSKKKITKRSLTLGHGSRRRNSFSVVKQGLMAMTLKKNFSNSALNINEADDEEEQEEEEGEERIKKTGGETKKATITDIAKSHFSRVFEPNSGG